MAIIILSSTITKVIFSKRSTVISQVLQTVYNEFYSVNIEDTIKCNTFEVYLILDNIVSSASA